MTNKERNIDHCIDFYLRFRWTTYRVRLFSYPDHCSDTASKRGSFIGRHDYFVYFGPQIIQILR